jgi:GNAT superfamily N-acetyltransferase
MLPRRVLDELDQGFLAGRWAEAIEAPPSPRHRVLVAVEQAGSEHADLGTPAGALDLEQAVGLSDVPVGGPGGTGTSGSGGESGGDRLVGFVASGPADEHALAPDEKPLDEGVVAITDLLVEPRWGRRGHGSRLLAASVDLWRTDRFDTAVAWAYERDAATRKFLTSAGWEPDGASRALDVDDLLVNQLRLHAAL